MSARNPSLEAFRNNLVPSISTLTQARIELAWIRRGLGRNWESCTPEQRSIARRTLSRYVRVFG